ncbi:hypothetical protein DSM106972_018270 [Dulcicalothrix desertica PCC 7102]|uniref:Uncharacterized protein n=1 Tax=Dulcicalothrix desertica PCC 7102 TaxID=232991 RepID=A0A3S1CNT6_9CYAN|nr:hypothetical protein [Dulcicalothrix desertica]RUT07567.1 hypothetical protein DSM106972_018270 [Dulcicalothrix desertica PCC 7102]
MMGFEYESSIIERIAKHPNTPIGMLEKLAFEKYPEITRYTQNNASVRQKIRVSIASNLNTRIYILEEILRTSDDYVRKIAKKNLKHKT